MNECTCPFEGVFWVCSNKYPEMRAPLIFIKTLRGWHAFQMRGPRPGEVEECVGVSLSTLRSAGRPPLRHLACFPLWLRVLLLCSALFVWLFPEGVSQKRDYWVKRFLFPDGSGEKWNQFTGHRHLCSCLPMASPRPNFTTFYLFSLVICHTSPTHPTISVTWCQITVGCLQNSSLSKDEDLALLTSFKRMCLKPESISQSGVLGKGQRLPGGVSCGLPRWPLHWEQQVSGEISSAHSLSRESRTVSFYTSTSFHNHSGLFPH